MNPVGMGFMAVRKLDRPGQIAGAAVAATVHQAADPAQGVSERDAGREDIGDFPERKVFEPDVKEASDRGADESTVKNQYAVPVDGEAAHLKGDFVHVAGKLEIRL